jgi:thioredoxin reductase (NADPH)
LEIGGVPFPVAADDRPRREDVLAYYRAVVTGRKLRIQTWERVQSIRRDGAEFQIRTLQQPDEAWMREYRAVSVILATGTWDGPRALSVPGADLKKVSRRLNDPTPYYGRECLVVGGGSAAADAALALARAGARTRMALLEASFEECDLRPDVLRELSLLADEMKIAPEFDTEVIEITSAKVRLRHAERQWTVANDFVFTMIGAEPDRVLLQDAGVSIDPGDHRPLCRVDTSETNVLDLFVAGSIARSRTIMDGRARAAEIVRRMAERLTERERPRPGAAVEETDEKEEVMNG